MPNHFENTMPNHIPMPNHFESTMPNPQPIPNISSYTTNPNNPTPTADLLNLFDPLHMPKEPMHQVQDTITSDSMLTADLLNFFDPYTFSTTHSTSVTDSMNFSNPRDPLATAFATMHERTNPN